MHTRDNNVVILGFCARVSGSLGRSDCLRGLHLPNQYSFHIFSLRFASFLKKLILLHLNMHLSQENVSFWGSGTLPLGIRQVKFPGCVCDHVCCLCTTSRRRVKEKMSVRFWQSNTLSPGHKRGNKQLPVTANRIQGLSLTFRSLTHTQSVRNAFWAHMPHASLQSLCWE